MIGSDAIFEVQILKDGVPVDLVSDGVTRVVIKLGLVELDSDVLSNDIDWESNGSEGWIAFKLGMHLVEPFYGPARVTIYDPANSNGIDWIHPMEPDPLVVKVTA